MIDSCTCIISHKLTIGGFSNLISSACHAIPDTSDVGLG
jgi:hypothetical protein